MSRKQQGVDTSPPPRTKSPIRTTLHLSPGSRRRTMFPFAMLLLYFAIGAATLIAARYRPRKPYWVDGQGRYVLLDLARPLLPPVPALLNFVLGSLFGKERFSAEKLIEQARKQTGLSDFGDETRFPFRDGMQVFLDEASEASLTFLGRFILKESVLRFLTNRLLTEDLIKRHPEILKEKIVDPVFIVGLPRSGTTVMHHFLGQLGKFRALRIFELWSPVVTDRILAGMEKGVDTRFEYSKNAFNGINKLRPLFQLLHPCGPDGFEEHIELTAPVFRSWVFVTLFHCPKYTDWYSSADATVEYEYLHRVLQIIQWQDARLGKGRRPFALKNPGDTFNLPYLKKIFPDARVVHMHRDPSYTALSLIVLLAYIHGLSTPKINLKEFAISVLSNVDKRLSLTDFEAFGSNHHVVKFNDFMTDNLGTYKEVAEFVGVDLDDQGMEKLKNFVRENRRHKHGKVFYDAELFGLNMGELRQRFRSYTEKCIHE